MDVEVFAAVVRRLEALEERLGQPDPRAYSQGSKYVQQHQRDESTTTRLGKAADGPSAVPRDDAGREGAGCVYTHSDRTPQNGHRSPTKNRDRREFTGLHGEHMGERLIGSLRVIPNLLLPCLQVRRICEFWTLASQMLPLSGRRIFQDSLDNMHRQHVLDRRRFRGKWQRRWMMLWFNVHAAQLLIGSLSIWGWAKITVSVSIVWRILC